MLQHSSQALLLCLPAAQVRSEKCSRLNTRAYADASADLAVEDGLCQRPTPSCTPYGAIGGIPHLFTSILKGPQYNSAAINTSFGFDAATLAEDEQLKEA